MNDRAIFLLALALHCSLVLAQVYPFSEPQGLIPVNPATHKYLTGCYSRYGDFAGFNFQAQRAEFHYCDNTPGAAPGDEVQLSLYHFYNYHRIIGNRLSTMTLFTPGMTEFFCISILLGYWTEPGCTFRQLINAEQWDRNVTLNTLSNGEVVEWETQTPNPNNPKKNIKLEVTENYARSRDHHVSLILSPALRANQMYRQVADGPYKGELVSMWWNQLFAGQANLQSFGVNLPVRAPSINVTAMDYKPVGLPANWFPEHIKTNPEVLPIWGTGGRTG